MPIDRRTKVASTLAEYTAIYIQQEANTDPLITVTSVDMSPDLKRAIIFVTTLPDGREADALIFLKRNANELRKFLKVKMRIKTIPHLDFMIDAGERHRQHMDDLVREIGEEKK